MDKKQIEALQSIIEKQDEAIRILSYRTDMILNMLSALTAALGGTKTNVYREVVIQQIDKFEKTIPGINAHLAEQEKDCSCPLISRQGLYLKLTLPADVDILAESDNPTHYADGFHCNARSPLQGYAMPFLHSVSA